MHDARARLLTRIDGTADLIRPAFPHAADGDTGRNLVVSLAPLRRCDGDRGKLARALLLSARGNSGNIANRFMTEFIHADSVETLRTAAGRGRRQARQAVEPG